MRAGGGEGEIPIPVFPRLRVLAPQQTCSSSSQRLHGPSPLSLQAWVKFSYPLKAVKIRGCREGGDEEDNSNDLGTTELHSLTRLRLNTGACHTGMSCF